MSDTLLYWIIGALFLGPVLAGVAYVLLKRMFSGGWLEWLVFLGGAFALYRWLHH